MLLLYRSVYFDTHQLLRHCCDVGAAEKVLKRLALHKPQIDNTAATVCLQLGGIGTLHVDRRQDCQHNPACGLGSD